MSASDEPPKNREEFRLWAIERCKERIANGQRMANEAFAEGDMQDFALARHSIGESTRFLEKLEQSATRRELAQEKGAE